MSSVWETALDDRRFDDGSKMCSHHGETWFAALDHVGEEEEETGGGSSVGFLEN